MEINTTVSEVKRFGGYTGKMIVVGVLIVICWIGSLTVLGVVSERQGREAEVAREVAEAWGMRVERAPSGISQTVRKVLYILPKDLQITSTISPEIRSRGIFSAPVYRADLGFSGSFISPNLTELGIVPSSLLWNEATLVIGLSDTRSVNVVAQGKNEETMWNNSRLNFAPGSSLWSVNEMGIHAPIIWKQGAIEQKFGFNLSIAGSKGISFLPLGDNTSVVANALWDAPSFVGAYLPASEDLTKDNFSATWQVSSLGRSYPSAWEGTGSGIKLISSDNNYGYVGFLESMPMKSIDINPGSGENYEQALASSAFGVNLFREVTFYTLVSRTVKYAILFIALTFLAFYLFEIIASIKVHPFQYLLIGASLVLFYLLLLSFSEHIGFGKAYLLSAAMTLGLVTSYSAGVLKAKSRAWIVALILAVLYAYLYAVLQLESYALLFGTLFLFVALATIMRATRKIEWYKGVE